MSNCWIIGDLHGEIHLLNKLLDSILRFNPDQIIFVGDYIDRGPHSREVVDRILSLEVPVTCLMGNHEMMMLNAMEDMGYGYSPIELWYYNGGEATLQSFGFSSFFNFQSEMPSKYQEFFRNLTMSKEIQLGNKLKVLATHAGISPAIPVTDQAAMKNYNDLNRYLLEKHLDPGDSFLWIREAFFNSAPSLWEGYLVVHGHTPTLKLKRYISSNGIQNFHFVENDFCLRKDGETGKIVSIDIDSGSVISGRLSGVGFFIEGKDAVDQHIKLRSITVTAEDIFPRDLGTIF